ncbi:MAG: ATP-binding protein [Bryobacteraceae bacterium]|jgi:predicted ATPase
MITLLEALGYRCLRYVSRPLGQLQILVGPNASGKTTFLDVVSFLGTLVSEGPETAVRERSQNPLDLIWQRHPGTIELAIEARIPNRFPALVRAGQHDTIRYEISLRIDPQTYEVSIETEKVLFKASNSTPRQARLLFPDVAIHPRTILSRKSPRVRYVVNKVPNGNDNFYAESGKGWAPSYKLGPRKSALGNLPADEAGFPVSGWLRELLRDGVQRIVLNSLLLRQASPPGQVRGFRPDGSNLPWVIQELKDKRPDLFRDWVAHVRTALADVEDIRIVVREDDKHAYLVIRYAGGLETPSWVVSDGTLRLLALTILAYLPEFRGIYLIEEPENGIHPTAVETVYQSLSSVYEGQVLVASHSPVLLGVAKAEQLLCFAKAADGGTDVVQGDQHPALRDWRGEVSLGALLASGILG